MSEKIGASWELNPGPLAYLKMFIEQYPKRESYH
ncbi:uncharacterized protein PRCAT00004842001 [Priceomyces carsonii]|nr:unnamed protein product [Priceomyces carsonii]